MENKTSPEVWRTTQPGSVLWNSHIWVTVPAVSGNPQLQDISQESWIWGPATITFPVFDPTTYPVSKNWLFLNLLKLKRLFSPFSWEALKQGLGCWDSPTPTLSFHTAEIIQRTNIWRANITLRLSDAFIALTLLRPGVVFAKGIVFRYIWVQKPQWIFRNVFSCHHFVVANDIRESNSRELLLGVRLYRVELGLCGGEKQWVLNVVSKFFPKTVQKSCSHVHKFRGHENKWLTWMTPTVLQVNI